MGNWQAMAVVHVKHGDMVRVEDKGAGTGDNGEDGDDSRDSGGELGGTGMWPSRFGGPYSPPGILPRIRLESWNSARLILEFDIPAESAWNIMGILFLLLCLVIPYRVCEKKIEFCGTSSGFPWDQSKIIT